MQRRFSVLTVAALTLVLCFPAVLVQASPEKSAPELVKGVVRDAAGAPVADAQVSLQETGNTETQQTATNGQGQFSLSCRRPGSYLLSVRKDGYRDSMLKFALPLTAETRLAISLTRVSGPASGAPQQAADTMQFSDKPDFTVAGITDWTAAGGHGSDVNLRASEALARETRTLGGSNAHPSDPDAERSLRAAVANEPSSFEANHALGAYYFRSRRFREAIPLLEKAHDLNAADYDNSFQLAEAYLGARQSEQAKALITKMLATNDRAELHRLMGDVHEQSNDALSAEREYERAVKQEPSEQNYFAWGGELLVHRAVQPAIEVFTAGVRAFPRSERMLAGLGAALYASGAYADAAQRVCEASDLNPSDPNPYLFLGKMEEFAPDALPCARDRLARFLRAQPNASANYYYAIALSKSDEAGVAQPQIEKLLRKAIELDPKSAPAYLQLGISQAERGDAAAAQASYEKAIAANPNLPEPHFRLAQSYKRAGENARAEQEFRTFQRLKQSDAAAVEQQRRAVRQFVIVLNSPGAPVR